MTVVDQQPEYHRYSVRSRHREMLAIATLAIIGSFVLGVGAEGERVHLRALSSYPLPKTCLSREFFGVRCPGCGLTRSFIHLAHGEWYQSIQKHRLGWMMFLATVVQLPYRALALWGKNGNVVPVRYAKAFGNVLIALLLANWVIEFFWP